MTELDNYTAQLQREEEHKKYLLKEIRKGASEEITNNPAFERTFAMYYGWMKEEVGSSYITPEISEDGKTITIVKEGVKKESGRLKNNRAIGMLRYSIDEAGNLKVEFDSGELYDEVDYAMAILDPKEREEFQERSIDIRSQEKCVLDTAYETDIYNKYGVQLSTGRFSDRGNIIPSSMKRESLSQQVLTPLHKPEFGYDDFTIPKFTTAKAEGSTSYRPENSLGIISTTSRRKDEMPVYELYPSDTEHPERLRYNVPIPAATYNIEERGYVVNQYDYPGLDDLEKLKEYLNDSFALGIEGSKTKEYDSEQYQGVLATMSNEGKEQTK